ncbi:hypothetical protein [Ekhidna sp.]
MKKVLLTIALVAVFGFAANAQTDQGGWVVGASSNLGFSSQSVDGVDENGSTFILDVKAGYFLIDNLAGGLNLGYSSIKQVGSEDALNTTEIGLFSRYYFNGTFYAGLGFDAVSAKFGDGDSVSGTQINIEAGYPIFIGGETVALEPSLNYSLGGGDLLEDSSTFGVNVGFFLYF